MFGYIKSEVDTTKTRTQNANVQRMMRKDKINSLMSNVNELKRILLLSIKALYQGVKIKAKYRHWEG